MGIFILFKMIKICKVCKNEFKVKPSHFERRICCSKICSLIDQRSKVGEYNNNYRGGAKEQVCKFCNKSFIPNNKYAKRKFCSAKCCSDNSIGRKVIIHENTLKAIKYKIEQGKINPDKKCKCGEKKEINSKSCLACFKNKIERKNKCIVCGKIHKKAIIVKTCSKKCNSILIKEKTIGENNPNWKGGIQTENNKQRSSDEYKFWRISVFERDNYKCQDCGVIGGKLHAHHIKYFSLYPKLRTELNNGITLCEKCHRKIHRKNNFNSTYLF